MLLTAFIPQAVPTAAPEGRRNNGPPPKCCRKPFITIGCPAAALPGPLSDVLVGTLIHMPILSMLPSCVVQHLLRLVPPLASRAVGRRGGGRCVDGLRRFGAESGLDGRFGLSQLVRTCTLPFLLNLHRLLRLHDGRRFAHVPAMIIENFLPHPCQLSLSVLPQQPGARESGRTAPTTATSAMVPPSVD